MGATLFQMLTGHPPFTGSSVMEVYDKIQTQSPEFSPGQQDALPAAARDACMLLLTRSPEDRPLPAEMLLHPWITGSPSPSALIMPAALTTGGVQIAGELPSALAQLAAAGKSMRGVIRMTAPQHKGAASEAAASLGATLPAEADRIVLSASEVEEAITPASRVAAAAGAVVFGLKLRATMRRKARATRARLSQAHETGEAAADAAKM
jgi:hypothetical protein